MRWSDCIFLYVLKLTEGVPYLWLRFDLHFGLGNHSNLSRFHLSSSLLILDNCSGLHDRSGAGNGFHLSSRC